MRWAHLRAILWLRWRVLMNLVSRRGKFGHVIVAILSVLGVLFALFNLLGAMMLGVELLPSAEPLHIMLVWAGITCLLLFGWMVGVMTELQRAESMSFRSLLHLPASLLGVHIYNYIGSFVSLSLFFALPIMLGFAAASVQVFGAKMLLLFPLIASFVCLLTALTYQLRGWLGTMMSNKRKRKNVITLITLTFVLLVQIPNLINIMVSRSGAFEDEKLELIDEPGEGDVAQQGGPLGEEPSERIAAGPEPLDGAQVEAPTEEPLDEVNEVDALAASAEDTPPAAGSKEEWRSKRKARTARKLAFADVWVTRLCVALPFGWLAYGARSLSAGTTYQTLLCMLGMFGLAALSLRRSYHTTMGFVTGVGSAASQPAKASVESAPSEDSGKPLFVSRELPLVGEEVSAISLAGMRNLWRAPEFKMLLLGPLILILLGGVMFLSGSAPEVSPKLRPMIGLGGIAIGLVSMLQLMQNLFGIDRDGFRAFLLCPIPRHRILLGKNLAAAPFAIGGGLVPVLGAQFFLPMGALHLLSTLLLSVAGFLLISIAANQLSILSPMRFKEGAMQPANAKFKVIIIQLVSLLLMPVILLPLTLPLLLELSAGALGLGGEVLIYPVTSLLVLLCCALLYSFCVRKQGRLMQAHEQGMLDTLTRAVA